MTIRPYKKSSGISVKVKKIKLRLISSSDNAKWNELMEKYHYLANGNMVGPQLRYVAEVNYKVIALIGFSNASYHIKCRDNWIGWNDTQLEQRRDFIVQNSRFLILPDVNTKNVASKVLSLAAKQISADWFDRFGKAVLLLETFTELDGRRRGTGYLAAGWNRVGETKGYKKNKDNFYSETCVGKTVWCKELIPNAKEILSAHELPSMYSSYEKKPSAGFVRKKLGEGRLKTLMESLREFDSVPRKTGQRYLTSSCLSAIVCGIFAGCEGVRETADFIATFSQSQLKSMRMWRSPRDKRCKPPSYVTLWRAVASTDPMEFERVVLSWFNQNMQGCKNLIHIDGKAITSTLNELQKGEHIVSAVSFGATPFCSKQ